MAIREKGDGWQVDVTWRGNRAPRVSVPTKAEALQVEARFKADLMAGVMPSLPGRSMAPTASTNVATLGQLQQYAMVHHWRGKKAETTAERNSGDWLTELGFDFPTARLTADVVDEVCNRWATQGKKPSTINRKLAALSVMLKIAVRKGEIAQVFDLPKKKEYAGRLRWFSEAEIASLESYFAPLNPDFLDLVHVALDTGFRYGELIKLTVRDYNKQANTLTTWVTKGDKPRSVPLTPRAADIVLRRSRGVPEHAPLFPDTLNSRAISRLMAGWKVHQGLPEDDEACFHSLRHTCCSRLVQRNVSLPVVKNWMGHVDISTTMRYAHLAPNAFEDALAALS